MVVVDGGRGIRQTRLLRQFVNVAAVGLGNPSSSFQTAS